MRAVNLGVDVVTLLPHLMTTPPYDGATAPAAASCWGGKQEGFCNGLSVGIGAGPAGRALFCRGCGYHHARRAARHQRACADAPRPQGTRAQGGAEGRPEARGNSRPASSAGPARPAGRAASAYILPLDQILS